uniref:Uncharacterized protein n=1 Tax=Tanacetum cinerariifolium TaxID=118510 RepID=A0A699ISB8_TANCI|nr:hypothetical protein [Tanacetum cinerariifolium]
MTAGGSSDGAGLELEVSDEQKGKFIDTSEGTGLKPEVPDVSKADSSKSNVDLKKTDDEEETQDDELVHTPENYVPIDDETDDVDDVDDEEYDCISEEMYSDVNVELKDSKREGEGKDDEKMTDTCHVDAEHENVNQEVAGDQVKLKGTSSSLKSKDHYTYHNLKDKIQDHKKRPKTFVEC